VILICVGNQLYFECPPEKSTEEHWRDERYKFFRTFNMPVITGHNLDDVIEWFLFSSLHGQGKVMPYNNKNVIRPFISTSKRSLEDWCDYVRKFHSYG
jgi:tRNA(Ile)-lysidine synthase TilS/MesJ